VVVSELLDVASRQFEDADAARAALTIVEPLQPFSAAAFGGGELPDARRIGFHGAWRAGAQAALGARVDPPPFADLLPAPEVEPQLEWTREQLLRALANPSREFLAERLGLRLAESSERLPESEPFALDDGLDRWQRQSRLLDLALAQPQLDEAALARRLLAEGRLAPGAAGRAALAYSLEALAPALEAWRGDTRASTSLPYELELGRFRLSGVLPRVMPDALRQFTASKAHGKTLLALGLDALVWAALGRGHDRPHRLRAAAPQLRRCRDAGARELPRCSRLRCARVGKALPFMPRRPQFLQETRIRPRACASARIPGAAIFGKAGSWVATALRGAEPFETPGHRALRESRAMVFSRRAGSPAAGADDGGSAELRPAHPVAANS
jgi:exodeoxyribonuclease V gamma subunit